VNHLHKQAFTVVELMVVIGIIIIVAAITFPIASSAKESAQRANCRSNLRQLHLATELYRADWAGDARFGSVQEMGLPYKASAADQYVSEKLKLKGLSCPQHGKPWEQHAPEHYAYFPMQEPDLTAVEPSNTPFEWSKFSARYGDETILFGDVSHNPVDHPYLNDEFPMYAFGVTLGGALISHRKGGDPYNHYWWLKENN